MQERVLDFTTDEALKNTRTILLNTGDPERKREEIRQYFHASYSLEEALHETLKYYETFYQRADELRPPSHTPQRTHPPAKCLVMQVVKPANSEPDRNGYPLAEKTARMIVPSEPFRFVVAWCGGG